MSLLRSTRAALRVASRAAAAAPRAHSALAPAAAAARSLHAAAAAHSSASPSVWKVDNPYTGEIVAEIPSLSESAAVAKIDRASATQKEWARVPLSQRLELVRKWAEAFASEKESIALSISQQMGKPLSQARGEVDTAIKRAEALMALAPAALAEESIVADPNPPAGLLRKISKEPVGVVLALVPWNYPLLCAVNSVVTAVLAGNSVLLKHSDRTPLCADAFERTFRTAGAPEGLVAAFHVDHALIPGVVSHPSIGFVQFTGSVSGGRAVYAATAQRRFIDVGLELGGKDAAYVAQDADLQYAIANVVDGGMYNAGQSCCAVERVYVHERLYDRFLEGAAKLIGEYKLGDPTADSTSMGPVAQPQHVAFLQGQVDEARSLGARVLVGGAATKDASGKGRFFAPTLIADASHAMRVMSEESFGPLLAVQSVKDDAEAVRLMNDSAYGLTASVWSSDIDRATELARQLDAGTVFMNRCDFLDPYLAWAGRKDSGKGVGLSQLGFAPFVRTKSWNFRPNTK